MTHVNYPIGTVSLKEKSAVFFEDASKAAMVDLQARSFQLAIPVAMESLLRSVYDLKNHKSSSRKFRLEINLLTVKFERELNSNLCVNC
jgi:hypothetical protein